jgi:hypothetical protein
MDPITAIAAAGVAMVAKGALESVGGEAGRSGWDGGARLIERIRSRFRADPEAQGAVDALCERPADAVAQEDLQRLLLAHMLRDRAFEEEVRQLVEDAAASQGTSVPQVSAGVIKNAQVFNEKVEVQGDWNIH